jgi:hypothetical protein
MAAIAASLIVDEPWPVSDVSPDELSPKRFVKEAA